jgi:cobalt-precorrin 5A hydrolase
MKLAIVAITEGGRLLAAKIADRLPETTLLEKDKEEKIAELLGKQWPHFDGFICIMAAGIVVRSIAPLLEDKFDDPCVVVLDESGRNVISLLSGHLGGGNRLALEVASLIGAHPVITTASDTLGLVPLDLWARDNHLMLPDRRDLRKLSSRLVNDGILKLYADVEVITLPKGLQQVDDIDGADLAISHRIYPESSCVFFRPPNLVVGTGCNRGTAAEEFESALTELFTELGLSRHSIRNLASIDKKNDEKGLLRFAAANHWQIDFFERTAINALTNLEISFAALTAVGAIGVAEPASLLSARSELLLSRKRKWKNVTMAVAEAPFTLSEQGRVQQHR